MRPISVGSAREAAAVALPPDQALVVGGHELPVLQREPPVGRVVQQRVVERAGTLGVDLVHSGDEPDPVFRRDLAEAVRGGPGTATASRASSPNAAFARGSDQPASALAQADEGYAGMNVSGKTASRGSGRGPSRRSRRAGRSSRSRSRMTGSAWTHATFTMPSMPRMVVRTGERDKGAVDHDEALALERLDRLGVQLCEWPRASAATSAASRPPLPERPLERALPPLGLVARAAREGSRRRAGRRRSAARAPGRRWRRGRRAPARRGLVEGAAAAPMDTADVDVPGEPACRTRTRRRHRRCSGRRRAARSGRRASRARRRGTPRGAG